MHMGTHQITVADVDARRSHRTRDHLVRFAEVILIVRAAARAISVDQGRLAATSGPAAALGIVGRRRWDITQIDEVQLSDVHAQFHRR